MCYKFQISDDKLRYRCTLTSVVYFSSFLLASCPDPGVPQNGQRIGTSFGDGKHLQFSCSSGYWLVGSQLIVCNEGKWSSDIPTCKGTGADPGFFLGGGALVSCSTSTPINRIPAVLENRRSSLGGGGGVAPPAPSP